MTVFTPRIYQEGIENFIRDNERANVFSGMGTGKTPATLSAIASLLILGEVRRVLILAPKRVALSTWIGERNKFENFHHLTMVVAVGKPEERLTALRSGAEITVCTYDLIEWLIESLDGEWPFDMVVADECFPAGTLISTADGSSPIEQVCVGDLVWTRNGLRKVTNVFKKTAKSLVEVRLVNGARLVCTPCHRVWTSGGWKSAEELGRSDSLYSIVSELRNAVRHDPIEGRRGREGALLQPWVQYETLDFSEASGVLHRGSRAGSEGLAREEQGLERRCSGEGNYERETASEVKGARPCARGEARWQRQGHERVRGVAESSFETGMGVEPADTDERLTRHRHPNLLQTGLLVAGRDGLLRGGRDLPHIDSRASAGREERVRLEPVGVDRVTHLQQAGLSDVWDLEVEEDHEYFADGFLVHNCSKLKALRVSLQRSKTGKTFITGQGGVRAKALAKVALARTKRWVGLTGTPAPNGLEDLWALLFFVDTGTRLGTSFSSYVDRYFQRVPGGDGYTKIRPLKFAQKEVEDKIRDVCLTIEAKDYFDLPPLIENTIKVDLPPQARRQYDDMEKRLFTEIQNHEIEVFNAAAKTNKCLQIASGAAYTDDQGNWVEVHDAKLSALESVVEEAMGMPVLVAYQFKSDLARILKNFKQARQLTQDPKMIDDWNVGKIPMLVVHPASAGHGLSLQHGSNILVFFSTSWNLENDAQVIERIGPTRQAQSGYDRPVFVHRIVAADTLEEVVVARLKSKASVQDALLEALKRREKPC